MTESRGSILAAVHAAVGPSRSPAAAEERPVRPGDPTLLCTRISDYGATLATLPDDGAVAAEVERLLRDRGANRVVVPAGFPDRWRPTKPAPTIDQPPLTTAELDRIDAALTGAGLAIAETGTIVLDAGPTQGRRALSLLPDLLICVVEVTQVVADVEDAFALLDPGQPITFISGPSATSDIELERVEGVHGPRDLCVLLVG